METPVFLVVAVTLACAATACAEIRPSAIFSDGMILQRDSNVPVWGSSSPGERITVRFGDQEKAISADVSGKWRVTLDPMKAEASPATMTIAGEGSSTNITGVMVGDVFLASGQSNMDFPLRNAHNAPAEIPASTDPQLRFFQVTKKTSDRPEPSVSGGKWVAATPQNSGNFSAVAYFFAKEIRAHEHCPVGVIQAAWGGTPIRIWMGLEGLRNPAPSVDDLADWDKAVADHARVLADPKLETTYKADLAQWTKEVKPSFDDAMKVWNAANQAGKDPRPRPKPSRPEPVNPDPMGYPSPNTRPHTPTVAYNAMIHPLVPYALKGFLWYQGEDNGMQGIRYRDWLSRLISDWRSRWGAEIPFLIVQLPCFGMDTTPVAGSGWPWLREAQFRALSLPKTGVAVTIDVGDPRNVHPADKVDVGNRLALLARRDLYGEKIDASGPRYDGFKVEGNKVRIFFTETAGGLKPGRAPWCPGGTKPLPTDKLVGFYIAGEDSKWVEAEAVIQGKDVVVSSPSVPKPLAVRYGWSNSPRCNLYNSEGLPAFPFRTDDRD